MKTRSPGLSGTVVSLTEHDRLVIVQSKPRGMSHRAIAQVFQKSHTCIKSSVKRNYPIQVAQLVISPHQHHHQLTIVSSSILRFSVGKLPIDFSLVEICGHARARIRYGTVREDWGRQMKRLVRDIQDHRLKMADPGARQKLLLEFEGETADR
jgi:IS30 family transposase